MEPALRDRRPDGLGDLRVIPDEILCAILVALTPRDGPNNLIPIYGIRHGSALGRGANVVPALEENGRIAWVMSSTKSGDETPGGRNFIESVMYILCKEEPLWMNLCLKNLKHQLEYKGSWKKTTLHQYVLILSLFLHTSIFVLEFVVVILCVLSLITFEESDQFSPYPAPLLGLQTTFTK
ncbi:hypothetical protein RJ639_007624 [Escallonia herrerae]|uniref:Uncharacterized protein n=1 Tax=Escallonia herrerae TaxID=1293975 RepID=A0AA89ATJ4_9ASTE|nr:hypothetical protein RJ639_007624 [Escallonia herrerae]